MEITNVRIFKEENGFCKGIASITIDDCFVVHNIRIIEKDDKIFIAMPNRKTNMGTYADICHPINSETREMITNVILEEYRKVS